MQYFSIYVQLLPDSALTFEASDFLGPDKGIHIM
jgi:hypothetical protein